MAVAFSDLTKQGQCACADQRKPPEKLPFFFRLEKNHCEVVGNMEYFNELKMSYGNTI